jgi:hypothetical protein
VKVRIKQGGDKTTYMLWCPACDDLVYISDAWSFNGDAEKPTFMPSLLTQVEFTDGRRHVCHSFVTDGVWNFLGDCTHGKGGKSMPVVDLPDWVLTD